MPTRSLMDKINQLVNFIQKNKKILLAATGLIILFAGIFIFIVHDENYYQKTIAKVTAVTTTFEPQTVNGSSEIEQNIKAVIMNGPYKGQEIKLKNTALQSEAYNLNLKINDEVFVRLQENAQKQITSAQILDFKRDTYIAYITIFFVLLIVFIGRAKGLKSLLSLIINIVMIYTIVKLYLLGYDMLLLAAVSSALFTIVTIFIVSGKNRKTLSAVLGTLAGTLITMLITGVVILLTHAQGIHYEEMEFLSGPPEKVFMAEILIGTLGAIMDIAITMASSVQEIYEQNPHIERKELIKSGMQIGKDIMGTMANTLVFAYLSGSIPIILLWLKNSYSVFYVININISLEIIRALTGSIGVVISIPISMYISILLLNKNKIGETL